MSSAGKVLMLPKGDYAPATTYKNLDVVYYEGRSYVCKQESTGNVPTNTTYWQPMTPDVSAEIQALTNQVNGNWSEGGKNLWANDNVSGTAFVKVTLAKALPAGTYTISAVVTSSDTDKTVCRIADGDGTNTLALIGRSAGGARVSATFTIGSALSEISFYASETYYFSTGDTFSFTDIQIEAGSTATEYTPYAKTNLELTQDVAVLKYDDGWLHLRKQGHLVNLVFDTAEFASDGKTFTKTIPAEFRPEQEFFYLAGVCYNGSSYVDAKLVVKNDGTIVLGDNFSNAIQGLLPTYFSGRNSLYYGV